jgi:hypothetical protein
MAEEEQTFSLTFYPSAFDNGTTTEEFKTEDERESYEQSELFYCDTCNRLISMDNGRVSFYRVFDGYFVCIGCIMKAALKDGLKPEDFGEEAGEDGKDVIDSHYEYKAIGINGKFYLPKVELTNKIMFYDHSGSDGLPENGFKKHESYFIPSNVSDHHIANINYEALKLLSEGKKPLIDIDANGYIEGYMSLWFKE